ncbi:AGAP011018-PA-like protein [Anopheles sinensis]|uniref:AGAP011018-PA-like protein n=1 Tax=Anopheles sinensis TaxID=74873 RepID=A0A084W976_ANOSI|nr:AGAP011018-PA-like protein [Anopheles sinensis]
MRKTTSLAFLFGAVLLLDFDKSYSLMRLSPIGIKATVKTNKLYVNASYALQQNGDPTNQTLDVEFYILRQIKSLKASFKYYLVAFNGSVQNALISRTVDVCSYMRRPSSDRLVNLVYSHVQRLGHIPSKCPIEPGQYYFRNLRTADLQFPIFLPESEFMLECVYYSSTTQNVYAEFRYYGKLTRFTYLP